MKEYVRVFNLIWLFVALLCSGQRVFASSEQIDDIGTHVSLINLLATPERYDRQLVFVRGYVSIEFENMSICMVKNALSSKDCLWLEIDSGHYETKEDGQRFRERERLWKPFHGKVLSIRGIFDRNDQGHLGQWSGAIKNVVDVYGDGKHLHWRKDGNK